MAKETLETFLQKRSAEQEAKEKARLEEEERVRLEAEQQAQLEAQQQANLKKEHELAHLKSLETPYYQKEEGKRTTMNQEEKNRLKAWAIRESSQLGQAPERRKIREYTKKKLLKPAETVVVYGDPETFLDSKSASLQEELITLTQQEGTSHIADASNRSLTSTFSTTLDQSESQELQFLKRLKDAQANPTTEGMNALKSDMIHKYNLKTGEETINRENPYNYQELLVLMIANMSAYILDEVTKVSQTERIDNNVLEALQVNCLHAGTYAKLIMKRTREKLLLHQGDFVEANSEAGMLRGDDAKQLAISLEKRRKVGLFLQNIITEYVRDSSVLQNENSISTIKSDVILKMPEFMELDIEQGDVQTSIRKKALSLIPSCSHFIDGTSFDTKVNALFQKNNIPEKERPYYLSSQEFRDFVSKHNNESENTTFLQGKQAVVAQSIGLAATFLNTLLSEATPEMISNMVHAQLSQTPSLLLSGTQQQIHYQMHLLAEQHLITQPHLGGQRFTQKREAVLNVTPVSATTLSKEIVKNLEDHYSSFFNNMKDLNLEEMVEKELLISLGASFQENAKEFTPTPAYTQALHQLTKRIATETNQKENSFKMLSKIHPDAYEKKMENLYKSAHFQLEEETKQLKRTHYASEYAELGTALFLNLSINQRATLVKQYGENLSRLKTLRSALYSKESQEVRKTLFQQLLIGTPIEKIKWHMEKTSIEKNSKEDFEKAAIPFQLLKSAEGTSEIPTYNFLDLNMNTASGESRQLRVISRGKRLRRTLVDKEVLFPDRYLPHIFPALTFAAVNQDSSFNYDRKLLALITKIKTNEKTTAIKIDQLRKEGTLTELQSNTVQKNLAKSICDDTATDYEIHLSKVLTAFQNKDLMKSASSYIENRNDRMKLLPIKYPEHKPEDLQKIFSSKEDEYAIATFGDVRWDDYVESRVEAVLPLLTLIDHKYSFISDLPDQLRLVFHKEIYSGLFRVKDADVAFDAHYKKIIKSDKSTSKKETLTIESHFNKLLHSIYTANKTSKTEQDIINSYFMHRLSGFSLHELLDSKILSNQNNSFRTLLINHNHFFKFLQDNSITREEDKESFHQYVKANICSDTEIGFNASLPLFWETFSRLQKSTSESVLLAEKTMEAKKYALNILEQDRSESVAQSKKDRLLQSQLSQVATGQRSIFMVELDEETLAQQSEEETLQVDQESTLLAEQARALFVELEERRNKKIGVDLKTRRLSPTITEIFSEFLASSPEYSYLLKPIQSKAGKTEEELAHILEEEETQTEMLDNATSNLLMFGLTVKAFYYAQDGTMDPNEMVVQTTLLALNRTKRGVLTDFNLFEYKKISKEVAESLVRDVIITRKHVTKNHTGLPDEVLLAKSMILTHKEFEAFVAQKTFEHERDLEMEQIATEELAKNEYLYTPDAKKRLKTAWLQCNRSFYLKKDQNLENAVFVMVSDFKSPLTFSLLMGMSLSYTKENNETHLAGMDQYSLTAKEQTAQNTTSRKDLEQWLISSSTTKELEAYNSLSLEERQFFALGLSMPEQLLGMKPTVTGIMFMRQARYPQQNLPMIEIKKYILTGSTDFLNTIDYNLATLSLRNQNNPDKLQSYSFHLAIDFARYVTLAREESIVPDTRALCNYKASIAAANPQATFHEKELYANPVAVKDYICSYDDKLSSASIKELRAMSEARLPLFCTLLRNRCLLDKSTSSFRSDSYVDQDARDALISQYARNLPTMMAIQDTSHTAMSQSVLALHSYQIKDHMDHTNPLSKNDLAETSLKRKTILDETLIREAIALTNQVFAESLRFAAIKAGNQKVHITGQNQSLYKIATETVKDDDSFNAFLREHVTESVEKSVGGKNELKNFLTPVDKLTAETMGLYMRYSHFTPDERNLFYSAISNRDVLDISKRKGSSRGAGRGDRDFVNPEKRNELLDEYQTLGRVSVSQTVVSEAIQGLFTAQINDSVDFVALSKEEQPNVPTSSRNTAIDWKLFRRGIQLVNRANAERSSYMAQQSLYFAEGDVEHHGHFQFDPSFLRGNLHKSGNQFTRFLVGSKKEKLHKKGVNQMGDFLSKELSHIGVATVEYTKSTKQEVKDLRLEAKHAAWLSQHPEYTDYGGFNLDFVLPVFEIIRETTKIVKKHKETGAIVEDGTTVTDLDQYEDVEIEVTLEPVAPEESLVSLSNLLNAENDKALDEEYQKQQKELDKTAKAASKKLNEVAKIGENAGVSEDAHTLHGATLQVSMGGLLEKTLNENLLSYSRGSKLVQEMIDAARVHVKYVKAAFKANTKETSGMHPKHLWQTMRDGTKAKFKSLLDHKVDESDFSLAYSGYENLDEYFNAKGMEYTQYLLFSASRYNPDVSRKILALAVLQELGITEINDDYSTENARFVFHRLMQ